MIKHFEFPAFRRPERDLEADDRRVTSVRLAVTSALASLDIELEGLSVRLEASRAWAGALLGTEDGSQFTREPVEERSLREAERQIMAGTERVSKLRELRRLFLELQAVLDRLTPAPALLAATSRPPSSRRVRT